MTHRDRAGDPPGRRGAAGDAGHRQGFPTPPAVRPRDRRRRLRKGFRTAQCLWTGPAARRCRGIATPRAPGRKPQPGSMGEAVSMGHYPRSLVLGCRPPLIAAGEGGMLAGG